MILTFSYMITHRVMTHSLRSWLLEYWPRLAPFQLTIKTAKEFLSQCVSICHYVQIYKQINLKSENVYFWLIVSVHLLLSSFRGLGQKHSDIHVNKATYFVERQDAARVLTPLSKRAHLSYIASIRPQLQELPPLAGGTISRDQAFKTRALGDCLS